jgi:hypothetical protein
VAGSGLAAAADEVDVGVDEAGAEGEAAEVDLFVGDAGGQAREGLGDRGDAAVGDEEVALAERLRGEDRGVTDEPEHVRDQRFGSTATGPNSVPSKVELVGAGGLELVFVCRTVERAPLRARSPQPPLPGLLVGVAADALAVRRRTRTRRCRSRSGTAGP